MASASSAVGLHQPPHGRVCDLCNGHDYELLCTRDRRGAPLTTVACTTCGLVGHEVLPTEAEPRDFGTRGEARPANRHLLRAWYKGERVVGQLQPTMRPGDRVFEIGAGLGLNLKQLELAGYDCRGIEPNPRLQRCAHTRLNVAVDPIGLFDYRARAPFDLILLIHVLEHFRSPRQALQKIYQLLAPGGRLYLECPSLGVFHADRAELFHLAHPWTFTPYTLVHLARQCGFEVHSVWSAGLGTNHKVLFVKRQPITDLPLPSYEDTCQILRDYHAPYHRFQAWYLYGRLRRYAIYAKEYLFASAIVKDIVAQCRQTPPQMRQSA